MLGSSGSELVSGILGEKRLNLGFLLSVTDLHPMASNPLENSRKSTNAHKKKPSQESAECVAKNVRSAGIHHTQAAFARVSNTGTAFCGISG